jgi:ribosomal protein S18 acetylase RimI-like enzyme
MTTNWAIRTGQLRDAETLALFNCAMALETENKTLDKPTVLRGVERLINNPTLGFYLVGGYDNQIHGSLMITYEWTDWRDGVFWWIQSVYIEPAHRRKGLFRALFHHVWDMAVNTDDVRGVRLYVEKNNATARRTYEMLKMQETVYRLYERLIGGDSVERS